MASDGHLDCEHHFGFAWGQVGLPGSKFPRSTACRQRKRKGVCHFQLLKRQGTLLFWVLQPDSDLVFAQRGILCVLLALLLCLLFDIHSYIVIEFLIFLEPHNRINIDRTNPQKFDCGLWNKGFILFFNLELIQIRLWLRTCTRLDLALFVFFPFLLPYFLPNLDWYFLKLYPFF